ncbi:MAG TPA: hemolysin III family protein [Abditibacteriaceae bacterium]|nr:hemolysin III family protein [Abditibacteriaceae bacterium]
MKRSNCPSESQNPTSPVEKYQAAPRRWWIKEPFCGLSHFIGIILSAAALAFLLILAQGRPWHLASFIIYGASLLVLYTASTLYHSLPVTPRWVERLMHLDHIAIYLLIAGTYTPVCLLALRGPWGWALLTAEYCMAALGVAAIILWKNSLPWLRILLYVCMGWLAVIAIVPLRAALPPEALTWLFAGGILYSIGTVIFAVDRPHLWPGKFSAHDLWHIFVLGGSACHFVLIAGFVARLG